MLTRFHDNVLPFWRAQQQAGQGVCLITLIGIDGSSPRPLGSQMAVTEQGQSFGYITGGCAEAALIMCAQNALQQNKVECIKLGKNSSYKDITLPCGSGLELYIHPDIHAQSVETLLTALGKRKSTQLNFNLTKATVTCTAMSHPKPWRDKDQFIRPYHPNIKLWIAGKGPVFAALCILAIRSGFELFAASPEPESLHNTGLDTKNIQYLTAPDEFKPDILDPHSALITLFHDHDWEPAILASNLDAECFYLGALGSRQTHGVRMKQLQDLGHSRQSIDRIRAPIGIDIQATTPVEISISILADIIKTYRTPIYGPPRW